MSDEQTTLSPSRGEIITSVEPDEVFLQARNAYLLAQSAVIKADAAYGFAQTVEANASNAASQATTAISLANAAQDDANQALSSQVSVTGATMTGALFLYTLTPTGPYEAAPKQYVDTQVSNVVTDGINSVANLKSDKTYVDAQDADLQNQIDTGSAAITNLEKGIVPIGGIIMWSGSTVPTNWALCNGLNGTPDLRQRFIIASTGSTGSLVTNSAGGVIQTSPVASIKGTTDLGGIHTHTGMIYEAGDHTHTITVGGTSLTLNQIPPHSHKFTYSESSVDSAGGGSRVNNIAQSGLGGIVTTQTEGGRNDGTTATHTHTATASTFGRHTHEAVINASEAHTHTVTLTPPYYALAFIMRVA